MTRRRPTAAKLPQHSIPMAAPISPSSSVDTAAYQQMFVSMALQMSWQLALVVVVPIVGGHALDEHYHTTPWLTLGGLAFAVIGVYGILAKTLMEANKRVADADPAKKETK